MKRTPWMAALAAMLALGNLTANAGWLDLAPRLHRQHVQYFGARRYTQRLAPQTTQPAPPPAAPAKIAPAPGSTNAAPANVEKSKEQKDAVLKRTIDFQKKRAEEGSASAQYDLGKRYLNGDGVEKDLAEAKKWFEAAAKQEHVGAAQKLEEIQKLEAAAAKTTTAAPAPKPAVKPDAEKADPPAK